MPAAPEASASGQIEVAAPPREVYALISDPAVLAEFAAEYTGSKWLDGATAPVVGARFRGANKSGFRRWSTVSTITAAEDGRRFAFQVTVELGPLVVTGARWQYDIEPTDTGCLVTESTWDVRSGWAGRAGDLLTGVRDRAEHSRRNIDSTLRNLKARAEAVPA